MGIMSWKIQSTWDVLIPITWFNWIVGLGAVEIPSGHQRPLLSKIYNILFVVTYFVLLYRELPYLMRSWRAYEKITFITFWSINGFVACCAVIIGWNNSQELKKLAIRYTQVDETLEIFGAKRNYAKYLSWILCYMGLWLSLTAALSSIDFIWICEETTFEQAFYVAFIVHTPILANSAVDVTFTVLISFIGNKFYKMNMAMEEVYKTELSKGSLMNECNRFNTSGKVRVLMRTNSRQNFLKHFIETSMQIHLELVRISKTIDKVYSLQIILEMGVQITQVTISLYNLYFSQISPSLPDDEKHKKVIAMSLWATVGCIKVVIISSICSVVERQAQNTRRYIGDLGTVCRNEDIRSEVQQFSLQLILHPLLFTPCGFFRLDNGFTRVFFGNVSTYVVILVQMSATPSVIKTLTEI